MTTDVSGLTFEFVDPNPERVRVGLHTLRDMASDGHLASRATIDDVVRWAAALPEDALLELLSKLNSQFGLRCFDIAEQMQKRAEKAEAALNEKRRPERVLRDTLGAALMRVEEACGALGKTAAILKREAERCENEWPQTRHEVGLFLKDLERVMSIIYVERKRMMGNYP